MNTQEFPEHGHRARDIPTLFLDRDLTVARFTPGVAETFGLSETARGRPVSEIGPLVGYEDLRRDAKKALEGPTAVEQRIDPGDGRTFLTRVLPDRDSEGTIVGVIASFIEISERIQLEEELRDANILAATIVETLNDPVLALTPDHRVLMVNPAFYEEFGTDPGSTIGRRVFDLEGGRWDHAELRSLLEEVLPSNQTFDEFEIECEDPNSGRRVLSFSGRRLDHLQKVLLVVRDISERRRLEEHIRKRERMESVGRLAAGIAHDFNNLLTAAAGHASLVLDGLPDDSELQEDVDNILHVARQASGLTHQLLAYARDQVLQERDLELRRMVLELQPMVQRLIPESIELEIDLPEEGPFIHADPSQIKQVLMNLVINAAEAVVEDGRIEIRVGSMVVSPEEAAEVAWAWDPGPFAWVRVRDSGVGMDPPTLERIFEPFFTSKEEGHGTGMGLSTVFGIVKQSGGHVLVDSAPGEGTTFEVLLPEVPAPSEDMRGHSGRAGKLGPASPGIGPSTKDHGDHVILLAEDDDSVRPVIKRMLERAGYTVLEARTGEEALQQSEDPEQAIDLLLSDVVMPGLSGVDLVRRVTANRPNLTVILMSGYAQKELQAEIRELADGFLSKPFTVDEVLSCVRVALSQIDATT